MAAHAEPGAAEDRNDTGPADDGPRDAFDMALRAHGLTLSSDEAEALFGVSRWLSTGLDGLDAAFPGDVAPVDADGGGAMAAQAALDLSIIEQGRMLREGQLTSVALVTAQLERIAARDGAYRAFYAVLAKTALEAARRADAALAAGQDLGPLHGIPVGIKDLIDVAGVPTTANAPGLAEAVAATDAEVVGRLAAAGAVIIGKLATYEWGTVGPDSKGLFPPARNPWNLERITGGSSSGNAAAVAGGLLRTSIGTDTGGSLRGPAFYCGVVGLKPTFGTVSTTGVLPMASSMDHVGPISASVAEAALTYEVISGKRGAAARLGTSITGLRVGYARSWFAADAQTDPAVLEAMDAALSLLSALGAVINEVELPDYGAVEVAAAALLHAESFAYHAEALRDRPEAYGRKAFLSLSAGVAVRPEEVARARRAGVAFSAAIDRLLIEHDALVTVGALTTALPTALFETEAVWTPMRTIGFNLSGHPVLAVPVGAAGGLPIGMQIIGRHDDEATIIQLGDAFERSSDFAGQRPPPIG
ncbi:MAG: amidase [Devosia sp.]